MFSVAKSAAVPGTSDEELRKGRGGDTAEAAGGAAEEAGAVGGNKFEAVKNNGEDKYPFATRSGVWRNHMYAKVKVEFNSLLIAKGVENPADYCITALSACAILKGHKKCRSDTSKRKHKIPEDVLDAITSLDFVFRKPLASCGVIEGCGCSEIRDGEASGCGCTSRDRREDSRGTEESCPEQPPCTGCTV